MNDAAINEAIEDRASGMVGSVALPPTTLHGSILLAAAYDGGRAGVWNLGN